MRVLYKGKMFVFFYKIFDKLGAAVFGAVINNYYFVVEFFFVEIVFNFFKHAFLEVGHLIVAGDNNGQENGIHV